MPSKDQDLFDMAFVFDSLDSFTESIEAHFESVARSLQDTFRATPWLPDSIKPRPPPPSRSMPSIRAPVSYFEASRDWISEHRAVSAAVVGFFGTTAYIVWRRRRSDRAKRRAKRAKNGARTEVVVLAGSPYSPLTRSLSLDLERRGFIVYIPVNSLSEEQLIQAESRADIRPLSLDITNPSTTEETIKKMADYLATPQHPTPNTPSHTLHLTSFLLLPSSNHLTGAISNLSPSNWSDTLNTHLLAPFTTLHAFLPLLISNQCTVLFLIPSITTFLAPASHAPSNVVSGGVHQYISTLRQETQSQGLNVVQIQLGHFDFGPGHSQQLVPHLSPSRAEATKARIEEKSAIVRNVARGSPLRELHNGVFDAIVRGKGKNSTIFLGRGSRMYDLVGRWVPSGVVGWMMGARPAPIIQAEQGRASSEASVEWEKVEKS